MRRIRISTTRRLAIFNAHGGICHLCNQKIDGKGWDVSHAIPLAMGGADDETNMLPAHRVCHRVETSTKDVPQIAQAKRREALHRGAKSPSPHPLPFGKTDSRKAKMGGGVEPRQKPMMKPALPRRPIYVERT